MNPSILHPSGALHRRILHLPCPVRWLSGSICALPAAVRLLRVVLRLIDTLNNSTGIRFLNIFILSMLALLAPSPKPKLRIVRVPERHLTANGNAVWDETAVREWSDVAWKAQQDGTEVNLGYLFALFVEKNSELPAGHPKRKFKGRVVFQGNRVTNQNWEAAIFQDL
eukprot:9703322-Heterocapsa_arctica.AAC.1